MFRSFGLPEPQRQFTVQVDGNTFRLDFAYPERRLAIELDGYAFHSSPERFRADRERQNLVSLAGWLVLRFTWHDITQRPVSVALTIAEALGIRPKTWHKAGKAVHR
jgi:very-short-patch-repair endonuclease